MAEEARVLLDSPGALDRRPTSPVWISPSALEVQLTQGALTLAAATSPDSHGLLDAVDRVLERTATDLATSPRKIVYHAAWLAREYVAAGDLERTVPAAQLALRRLPTVASRRCALVLRRLEDDLAALPPTRHPVVVRSLQDQLRAIRAA